mmetsp:Transcript_23879/g.52204  ORF Transcript_23879/g.52204 Transcript_23879/m.52204 type:complete len:234 (+) Transcript_23879:1188-1889(+)
MAPRGTAAWLHVGAAATHSPRTPLAYFTPHLPSPKPLPTRGRRFRRPSRRHRRAPRSISSSRCSKRSRKLRRSSASIRSSTSPRACRKRTSLWASRVAARSTCRWRGCSPSLASTTSEALFRRLGDVAPPTPKRRRRSLKLASLGGARSRTAPAAARRNATRETAFLRFAGSSRRSRRTYVCSAPCFLSISSSLPFHDAVPLRARSFQAIVTLLTSDLATISVLSRCYLDTSF